MEHRHCRPQTTSQQRRPHELSCVRVPSYDALLGSRGKIENTSFHASSQQMQPPPGAPLALQAPPARDPVTKLQILLGNLLKHFTDVVVHLSEVAPSRSLLGAVEAAPAPAEGTSSAAGAAPDGTMTQEQLNDFILSCSRGVGSLVQLIEEEANKLPDGYQSQAEVAEELRYLAAENELASSELRRLVAVVRHVREAARESYRAAATEGARITID